MKCIYIAGPYRAKTHWELEQNIRRAEEMSLEVAKLGLVPICPHTMCRFFAGQNTEEFWVKATLEMMRRCDAAIFCSGWQQSEGSKGEMAFAVAEGMPTFLALDELKEYVENLR